MERMPVRQRPDPNGPTTYQIQVQGRLDEDWSVWFSGMTVTSEGGVTTLTGPVADQAALRGILTRIWDLNLTLLSVTRGGVQ
jgi:osmotically-inducible protein OsmY